MAITTAIHADIPALNRLVNSAFRGDSAKKGWTHEADIIHGTLRTDEATIEGLMNTPGITFLQYWDDTNTLQGCVCLQVKPKGLYLGMLTVNPDLQGGGIGKQLLVAAEEHARETGCSSIYMTVISLRTELIAWYIRHGYVDTGERVPFEVDTKYGTPIEPLWFVVLQKNV